MYQLKSLDVVPKTSAAAMPIQKLKAKQVSEYGDLNPFTWSHRLIMRHFVMSTILQHFKAFLAWTNACIQFRPFRSKQKETCLVRAVSWLKIEWICNGDNFQFNPVVLLWKLMDFLPQLSLTIANSNYILYWKGCIGINK